jgi:hypothetical protein
MSANTPKGRKAKGREFQNEIRQLLLESFPELEEDDVKCALMGESGEDIKLSPAARRRVPYSIEAKRQERLNIWDALKQANANTKDGTVPAVFFRRNRSDTYVVVPATHFIDLIRRQT